MFQQDFIIVPETFNIFIRIKSDKTIPKYFDILLFFLMSFLTSMRRTIELYYDLNKPHVI